MFNNKNKTILIVGCAGFIGTNLTKRLLDLSNNIIGIDNFYSSTEDNIKLFKDYENHQYKFIKHDIVNEFNFDILKLLLESNITEIYHLAMPASPPLYQADPIKTIETGIIGTINILKLAVLLKSKLLFTSTSEIYGDPEITPQHESYRGNVNTVGIRACYDESKRIGETLCYEYKRKYNLDIKVVRIFNTYGPYMDINDGRVITNYINCILNNLPITIYGNGLQTRSFCYIDDLVDGLIRMMHSTKFGPINLGNPTTEVNMLNLLEIFEKIIDKKMDIKFMELPQDDPKQRNPDIGNAIKYLGWYPKTSLNDGIFKTLNYFIKKLDKNN
jgi:UDP-glucuronate decarboxylase